MNYSKKKIEIINQLATRLNYRHNDYIFQLNKNNYQIIAQYVTSQYHPNGRIRIFILDHGQYVYGNHTGLGFDRRFLRLLQTIIPIDQYLNYLFYEVL